MINACMKSGLLISSLISKPSYYVQCTVLPDLLKPAGRIHQPQANWGLSQLRGGAGVAGEEVGADRGQVPQTPEASWTQAAGAECGLGDFFQGTHQLPGGRAAALCHAELGTRPSL